MHKKVAVFIFVTSLVFYSKIFAETPVISSDKSRLKTTQTESKELQKYSGNIGTGSDHATISSTGGTVEFTPGGSNFFVFFSQTLANDFYYEARIYARNNYNSQLPVFNNIPASNEHNPWGYGAVVKLGYDFRPTNLIDVIPYLRLNAYNNMAIVYQDSHGNSISSTAYAILPGVKIAYKVTPQFNPYVDLFGGWQQVNLNGTLVQSNVSTSMSSTLNQFVLTYEIGFSSKLTNSLSLIPYMQYVTTANNPDAISSASYENNGFNINGLTNTQQIFGLKFAYAW